MTAIIAYKDMEGEILIIADSRVSWRFSDPAKTEVHVDQLQKVYLLAENVVIAFATNDLRSVKDVLMSARNGINMPDRKSTDVQYAYDSWETIRRSILSRSNYLHNSTKFIVAKSWPGQPKLGKVALFEYSGSGFVDKEIAGGEVVVAGSIKSEARYHEFQQNVISRGIMPENNDVLMCHRQGAFDSHNLNFQTKSKPPFSSVGEIFHSAYTADGVWWAPSSTTQQISIDCEMVSVSVNVDRDTKTFFQVNESTGMRVDLIPIDLYDFDPVPSLDNVFCVRPTG
jgi:hypothetical protein